MDLRPTLHSRIYRDFLAIEPRDYHAIIRFYEEHEPLIIQLEPTAYYEIQQGFTHALFEVGAYRQFLVVVDHAILATLDNDHPRRDAVKQQAHFEELLFRKSASYLQTLQYKEAEHVARELIRINAKHELGVLLLRKALRRQDQRINYYTRPASIVLFAFSALIILIEVLLVRPFYHLYADQVELTRNLIFLSGLLVLGGGEAITLWRAYRKSQDFLREL